jgi:hypothetical protein
VILCCTSPKRARGGCTQHVVRCLRTEGVHAVANRPANAVVNLHDHANKSVEDISTVAAVQHTQQRVEGQRSIECIERRTMNEDAVKTRFVRRSAHREQAAKADAEENLSRRTPCQCRFP